MNLDLSSLTTPLSNMLASLGFSSSGGGAILGIVIVLAYILLKRRTATTPSNTMPLAPATAAASTPVAQLAPKVAAVLTASGDLPANATLADLKHPLVMQFAAELKNLVGAMTSHATSVLQDLQPAALPPAKT